MLSFRGEKKTKKPIKPRKSEKKLTKKTEPWKKLIKQIKILKKPTGSVQFYKPEIEKTESNRTQTGKKPSQTGKNRAKLKKPSQTGKNWAKPVWTGFCPK